MAILISHASCMLLEESAPLHTVLGGFSPTGHIALRCKMKPCEGKTDFDPSLPNPTSAV